jgi:sphingolipid delta-4 desaturase
LARREGFLSFIGFQALDLLALYKVCVLAFSQVVAVMTLQVAMAYFVRDAPWWKLLVAAYVVSGTASQNLFCAQHELSHFLAFKKPLYNRVLSLLSNCPLVVPMATSFRKYHQEHHSHLVCCQPIGIAFLFHSLG